MSGSISLTVASTPRSATMTASSRQPRNSSRKRYRAGYSFVRGMVLSVRYTLRPILCASSTASYSSGIVKFPACERIPKLCPARYTASAPNRRAALSFSGFPAGDSNSGMAVRRPFGSGACAFIPARIPCKRDNCACGFWLRLRKHLLDRRIRAGSHPDTRSRTGCPAPDRKFPSIRSSC